MINELLKEMLIEKKRVSLSKFMQICCICSNATGGGGGVAFSTSQNGILGSEQFWP